MLDQDEQSSTDPASPLSLKAKAPGRSAPAAVPQNLPYSMQRPNALRQANELKRHLHAEMDALMCGAARPIDPTVWTPPPSNPADFLLVLVFSPFEPLNSSRPLPPFLRAMDGPEAWRGAALHLLDHSKEISCLSQENPHRPSALHQAQFGMWR